MRMRFFLPALFALALLFIPSSLSAAASSKVAIKVVVSIKPIHSLVAGVMNGVGEPYLIIKTTGSPHGYNLKPSDARALAGASVVFWAGPQLEKFLETPIKSLANKADIVTLISLRKLTRLIGETHEELGHHEDGENAHIWLDPDNAKVMVTAIALALVKNDPKHGKLYRANAITMVKQLDNLSREIVLKVDPVRGKKYMVFHDAYGYFENRFGLKSQGFIALNPDRSPGAKRLKEIRQRVKTKGVTCIFTEPQFNPKMVHVISEGSDARLSVLDPIGAQLKAGPNLYFELLRNMASSLSACLAGKN